MDLKQHFELLARYNQWMNSSVYASAQSLPDVELTRNRNAFFKSIVGTLNHIMVGDLVWLGRFAKHTTEFELLNRLSQWPQPQALDQVLFTHINALAQARQQLDDIIIEFVETLQASHLQSDLNYHNMRGEVQRKNFGMVLQHFFNHQTHHRGQVTTLFSQLGIDVGVTDLLVLIPDAD